MCDWVDDAAQDPKNSNFCWGLYFRWYSEAPNRSAILDVIPHMFNAERVTNTRVTVP